MEITAAILNCCYIKLMYTHLYLFWYQKVITDLAFVFCRIVFLTRGKMIPLSVSFIKAPFTWEAVAAVVSDGSSASMAPSAAVRCLLMSLGGWEIPFNTATNLEQ